MRQAREHAPECIERLLSIVRDPKAAHRDVIAACLAILDRGLGRPIVPIFRNTSTGLPDEMVFGGGAGDNEVTALIMAARAEGGDYRKALADELARLDREEREEKAARKDEIDEARAAQARGEPISPLMKMLISVQDETS